MLEKTASMLQGFAQKEFKCKTEGMQRFCKLVRLMQCCHLDFAQRLGLSEEYHGTSHCRMSRESNWMLSIVVSRNEIWRAPGTPWLAVLPKLWQRTPMSCATPGNSGFSIEPGPCAMADGEQIAARCCQTPETSKAVLLLKESSEQESNWNLFLWGCKRQTHPKLINSRRFAVAQPWNVIPRGSFF